MNQRPAPDDGRLSRRLLAAALAALWVAFGLLFAGRSGAAVPDPTTPDAVGSDPATGPVSPDPLEPPIPVGVYPLSIVLPLHVGLFHWVDSIAGTSGGKTIPIYRSDFARRFHVLSPGDRFAVRKFRLARIFHAEGGTAADRDALDPDVGGVASPRSGARYPPHGSQAMLGSFMSAQSTEGALTALRGEMPKERTDDLRQALDLFSARYLQVWRESAWLPRFARELESPRFMQRLQSYLAQMAAFFGVSPDAPPRPRLVLVPVPPGGGTHAQAVGTDLLLEIRPGDDPAGQAAVIAHENAHFLFNRIPPERLASLERAARRAGPRGAETWAVLHEALPTALGQGIAASRFQPRGFNNREDWYHIAAVDRLAKKIYPVLDRAFADGWSFDERLVGMFVRAAEGP
jgi:hypothetical protein